MGSVAICTFGAAAAEWAAGRIAGLQGTLWHLQFIDDCNAASVSSAAATDTVKDHAGFLHAAADNPWLQGLRRPGGQTCPEFKFQQENMRESLGGRGIVGRSSGQEHQFLLSYLQVRDQWRSCENRQFLFDVIAIVK